jgi:hypothetical protein
LVREEEQRAIGAAFLTKEREGALVARVGVLKEQEVWRVAEDNSMDTMREIIEKNAKLLTELSGSFWGVLGFQMERLTKRNRVLVSLLLNRGF